MGAAHQKGWVGIGLQTDDLAAAIRQYGLAGMKSLLDDHGIQFLEFEALLDWFATGDRRAKSDQQRQSLLRLAEELGAYQIKVAGDLLGGQWPTELLIEEFALLCRDAAFAGTQISLEIFAGSDISTIKRGREIVEGAAAANGGLLLDIWHIGREQIPYEEVKTIKQGYLKHVELCDARRERIGTIMDDTINRRLLPGEGDFRVVDFLRHLIEYGYDGLYGVEILSDAQRSRDLDDAALAPFNAVAHQFELVEQSTPLE